MVRPVVCPLSKSDNVLLLESISVKDLDALYRRLYKTSIKRLFPDDEFIHMYQSKESDLIWFDPLIPGDETFYNALQEKEWYYVDYKREFDVAAKYIKPTDMVIEVGSGKGNFGRFVKSERYVGLDFSLKAKEMAAKNGVEVLNESIQQHAAAHPEAYDVSCAFQVLEHVPDVYEFLKGMVDVLKPGGKLIVAVPSQDSYISKSNNSILNLPPHHMSRYTDKALEKICDYLPLELVAIEHDPLQPQHYSDYIYQLTMEAFRVRMGITYRSVNRSLINWLCRIPATILGRFFKSAFNSNNIPSGHTVVAVYSKKSEF